MINTYIVEIISQIKFSVIISAMPESSQARSLTLRGLTEQTWVCQ